MTRCPDCGQEIHEPRHVVVHDPALPDGQYRTDTAYTLHDGSTLRLWLGRGKIVTDTEETQ